MSTIATHPVAYVNGTEVVSFERVIRTGETPSDLWHVELVDGTVVLRTTEEIEVMVEEFYFDDKDLDPYEQLDDDEDYDGPLRAVFYAVMGYAALFAIGAIIGLAVYFSMPGAK